MTKRLKLNWTVKEYIGSEVYHKLQPDTSLFNENDLKDGDEIICFSWYFTVKKYTNGELYGQNKQLTAILEFAKDDRKCWVCSGIINMRAVKKLTDGMIIE
jgi:hypothetical protein